MPQTVTDKRGCKRIEEEEEEEDEERALMEWRTERWNEWMRECEERTSGNGKGELYRIELQENKRYIGKEKIKEKKKNII